MIEVAGNNSNSHEVQSMHNYPMNSSMIIDPMSQNLHKRNRTGFGNIGGVNLLAGISWVSKDETPSRKDQKVNVS